MPPVGGTQRLAVASLFTLAVTLSSVGLGATAGSLWTALGTPPLGEWAASALLGVALLMDLSGLRPLATHRQVPREWGRLLGGRAAAVLYGLRLGIGPLTILNSWAWWIGLIVGVSHGAVGGTIAGAAFALSRAGVTLGAGYRTAVPGPGE